MMCKLLTMRTLAMWCSVQAAMISASLIGADNKYLSLRML